MASTWRGKARSAFGAQKPEYALKRAEELIELNRKSQAFDVLYAIACRRQRLWTKSLELLVVKFLDLSVEMNKGKRAKEAFHHYRNLCQMPPTPQLQSLDRVISHFILVSEQQTEQKTNLKAEERQPSNLGAAQLMQQVTGEDSKERSDRELVNPWLKFQWEAYRTVLETLRTCTKLENLYKDTANRAFKFCRLYKRTNEFRRLADLLRQHFKLNSQYNENPESVLFQLEIQFGQLNTAVELELWQEAYKSVEDIHGSLMILQRSPSKILVPLHMIAKYYEQLSKLFLVSNNYIFHAHALTKYAEILNEIEEDPNLDKSEVPKLTQEEKQSLYSRVFLAALSVPIANRSDDSFAFVSYDLQREKELRLGALLDFDVTLSRGDLLDELVASDIFSKIHSELEELYNVMEVKFQPFQFGKALTKIIDFLKSRPDLAVYSTTIMDVSFVKLFQQLSNVYKTIAISRLSSFLPFWEPSEIEIHLVYAIQSGAIECSIDHKQGYISFKTDSFESEDIRYKLTEITRNLHRCVSMIKADRKHEIAEKRRALIQKLDSTIEKEREQILLRKKSH